MASLGEWLKNLFSGKSKQKSARSKLPKIDVKKRFDLLGRTGQGSMSKVWRARDMKIGRVVCLKLLDKAKTAHFESRFTGLNRPSEGFVCMMLKHPNIVQTFEHGTTTQGEDYLVMELIEGMGLNYLVETKSPMLNGKRVELLMQIADSLEYLHSVGGTGFLHRDICPRNIMVTQEGEIKLIDFGLTIPNTFEFHQPGNRTGTPNYLAPEIIRRSRTDARVDMFALGVTAYEMFTHDLPWEKAQSLQTLLSHMNQEGRDPRTFRPDLDDETVAFLMKAIERDPRDRFQTPAAFRHALEDLPNQDW